MFTILLTGFAPFGDNKSNPSQQIVERLDGATLSGARVLGLTLPVVFGEDTARVFGAIADHRPARVLMLGLNAGAACLDVERFGVNLMTLSEDGRQGPIMEGGDAALFATINADRVAQAVRDAGVPARAHGYAGAYLCNHILYQTLHHARQQGLDYHAGFIHLPLSSEQAVGESRLHQSSLPLDLMTAGVRAAVEAIL